MKTLKEYVPITAIAVGLAIGIFLTDVTKPITPLVAIAFLLIAIGIVTRFALGWGGFKEEVR